MKEDYNIKDPKVDDLINRLRFKLPEYDALLKFNETDCAISGLVEKKKQMQLIKNTE